VSGYDWDAIKAAHPIADLIGQTVQLKRNGVEFVGLCPFHNERSPSFTVNPDKGFYHCFGCGAHGDAVDFIAASQNISAADAVTLLTGGAPAKLSRDDHAARSEMLKARAEADQQAKRGAIIAARRRWNASGEANAMHPYLVRKAVLPHIARSEGDNLLLPIYGADGEIQSVQTIAPDGEKRFSPGAPTKAGRAYIGVSMGRTIVAEGFATAASIHAAMPDQVCIAYSKSNMAAIARELSAQGVSLLLASDTGAADEMRALGDELGCPVAVPESGGDFNDQAAASGSDNVRMTLDKALRDYAAKPNEQSAGGLPFAIDGVCLKSPPGFVGEVAQWIESQNRRPRAHLSAAAALVAIANVAGMRFVDARDGITANLFAFCIAGSRTGKESVQQAIQTIHRAAGCAPATHGGIKSEQEIIRNLTRHQAAYYVVDEIGIILQKIQSAQKRGGAAYLEGVIGVLMSAYSKASGFLLLSGDVKEDVRKALLLEAGQMQRKIDDGDPMPYVVDRLANITAALDALDSGLERPFLSLIGFTTPVTFDDLVDYQTATNGFIGRALLFNERDTAPRTKKGFCKNALPEHIAMRLSALHNGGAFDASNTGRVEWRGAIEQLPTTDDAGDMLSDVLDWFEDQAVAHKSTSGLESLFLGAYELVGKVSLILGIPDGERNADHVRWAFALIKRDVEDKMRLVIGNDRAKDAPGEAIEAKIINACSSEEGETIGVIANRLRGYARADIEKAIARMVEFGLIEVIDRIHKLHGTVTKAYRAA
jgi:phage/plasmid primase-like uncharacterized protein